MTPIAPDDLRQSIRDTALNLGFHLIGFAPTGPFGETNHLIPWLEKSFHASMDYIEKRKHERLNLKSYFPNVKSVISLGLFYHPREKSDAGGSQEIQIARYARGKDYHVVIPKLLKQLLRHIHSKTNCETKLCVDTAPVLERLYGYHAGLGWIGKNTCLIHPKYGSYFFLSEILIDIDLAEPITESNHCGSCTKCLEACPTQAFPQPYVLDARKCISYLTIEHRGEIPEELKDRIGNNLFGCDICQQVCPWNHETKAGKPFPLKIHPAFSSLDSMEKLKEKIEKCPEDDFSTQFAGRPLKRAKLNGLRRNLKIVEDNGYA